VHAELQRAADVLSSSAGLAPVPLMLQLSDLLKKQLAGLSSASEP
jgi:hypothetical protein